MPGTEADLPFTSIVRRFSWRIVTGVALSLEPGTAAVCARAVGGRAAAAAAEASKFGEIA